MELSQEWLDVTPADVYYNQTGIRKAEVDLRTKAYRIEYKRKKQLSFEISMVILNRFKPFAVPHKSLALNKDLTHIPSVSLLCKLNLFVFEYMLGCVDFYVTNFLSCLFSVHHHTFRGIKFIQFTVVEGEIRSWVCVIFVSNVSIFGIYIKLQMFKLLLIFFDPPDILICLQISIHVCMYV